MRAVSRRPIAVAAGAGVALGAVYSLSPMTVLCLPLLVVLAVWAGRGLTGNQRRWFVSLLAVAVFARLAVIAGLFLSADAAQPFATLFGDEQFFKNRGLWMRNIGLGVPMSSADIIYAYDEIGRSSYLYLLAYLQALLGDLPYGVHVMNATVYLAGVLLVYRYVRPVFGEIAALAGLALLLFFPSLFVWSISALKEPLYTLVAVGELLCCLWLVRGRVPGHRVAAALGLVVAIFALESLRRGGMLVGIAGAFGGLALGAIGSRPRLAWAALAAAPVLAVALLIVSPLHDRVLSAVRMSAVYHAGHIMSEGYSYKILDSRYYHDRNLVQEMRAREAGQFVVRSVVSYVTEPVPWRAESAGLRAYFPEQMLWYVLLVFVPFGLIAGFRLDPLLTGLLASHAGALVMMVALTSGNIGTLIRHRGLALPYLAWLSGLGFCRVVNYLMSNTVAFEYRRPIGVNPRLWLRRAAEHRRLIGVNLRLWLRRAAEYRRPIGVNLRLWLRRAAEHRRLIGVNLRLWLRRAAEHRRPIGVNPRLWLRRAARHRRRIGVNLRLWLRRAAEYRRPIGVNLRLGVTPHGDR